MKASIRRIAAVAGQSIRTSIRLRIFFCGLAALVVALLGLPFLVRHNGTARMFAQVMITYNLVAIVTILGLVALGLACQGLAGEIASGQLQVVAVKPIRRWQLWIGKWIGLSTLQAVLLAFGLVLLWFMLLLRARDLTPDQQAEFQSAVLVARASLRESPPDLRGDVDTLVSRRMAQGELEGVDPALVLEQMEAFARARHETLAPHYQRVWRLPLAPDAPGRSPTFLHLRVQFHAATTARNSTYPTVWIIGDTASGRFQRVEKHLTAGVSHEFAIAPDLASIDGILSVACENRSDSTLLFRLDDGLELLRPIGGFGANLARSGVVIWCWLALLTALGLAASSLLSFPTALIASFGLLYLGSSGGTLAEVVQEGTVFGVDHDHPASAPHQLDRIALPVFKLLHSAVHAVVSVSPLGDLGLGRAVGWDRVSAAFLHVVLLTGGAFALAGIAGFQRRQLGLPSVDA
jgi:hypothetical protein